MIAACIAASHQGVFHMFWPQFWAALIKSNLYKIIFYAFENKLHY